MYPHFRNTASADTFIQSHSRWIPDDMQSRALGAERSLHVRLWTSWGLKSPEPYRWVSVCVCVCVCVCPTLRCVDLDGGQPRRGDEVRGPGGEGPGPEQQVSPGADRGHWDGHLGNRPQPGGAGACGGRLGETDVHGEIHCREQLLFSIWLCFSKQRMLWAVLLPVSSQHRDIHASIFKYTVCCILQTVISFSNALSVKAIAALKGPVDVHLGIRAGIWRPL